MTAKPTLCRVPSYRLPGLPRPTTTFIVVRSPQSAAKTNTSLLRTADCLLLLFAFLLGGLATDDFRLGLLGAWRRGGFRLGLRSCHVDDDSVRIGQCLDVGRQVQVTHVDGAAELQL